MRKLLLNLCTGIFLSLVCNTNTRAQAPNITYSTPQVYFVNTPVSPLSPTNTGGAVGTYTQTTFKNPIYVSNGVAVNPLNGNIYISSSSSNNVTIYTSVGTQLATQSGTPYNYNYPTGIAIDAAGSIYVANSNAGTVVKTTIANVVTTITGFAGPTGVTIDASGNIYVVDRTAGNVYKLNSSSTTAGTPYITGLSQPWGATTNAVGDLFVSVPGPSNSINIIYKYAAGSTVQTTFVSSGLSSPRAMVTDGLGNIYETDASPPWKVNKISPAGVVSTLFTLGDSPTGIAMDASGNLYVTGVNYNNVFKFTASGYTINPALPAGLNFNAYNGVISGTPTTVSPATNYTVTATNGSGSNSCVVNIAVGGTIDWTGNTSTDWNTASNWSTNTVPTINDIARIAVNTSLNYVRQPLISATPTTTITNVGSIILGTKFMTGGSNNISVVLTVNSPLVINTNLITNTNFTGGGGSVSSAPPGAQYQIITIAGSSTVTTPVFKSGDGSAPTLNSGVSAGTYLNMTGTLTVNGDITITGVDNSTGGIGPSALYIASGLVSCNRLVTSNLSSTAYSYLFLDVSALGQSGSGTLQLNGVSPIVLDANGKNSFVLSSSLSSTASTINYNNNTTGATQTVYATLPSNFTNATYTSFFSAGKYIYDNITFTGNSTKQLDATGPLYVSGNWNSTGGKIDLNTKGVIFTGSVSQNITDNGTNSGAGIRFYDVKFSSDYNGTVSNSTPYNKTLSGVFSVNSINTLTMGAYTNLIAPVSGKLTLKSDATGTASVAAIPSTSSITGNVSVERYFRQQATGMTSDNTRGYRLLSSPVNNNAVINNSGATATASLAYVSSGTGLYTAGPTGTGGGFTQTNATPFLYLYKESLPTTSGTGFNTGTFKGITNLNSLTVFNDAGTAANATGTSTYYPGNGFLLFYAGSNTTGTTSASALNKVTRYGGSYMAPDAATTTATGTLNQGAVPVKLWWNGSTTLSNVQTGYNLVGNPYASTIDWNTFSTSNSANGIYGPGVASTIYVYNYSSKNYSTYQTTSSTTGNFTGNASNLIASGQGFYIKASTGATLTFNEAAKTATQPVPTSPTLLMGLPAATAQSQSLRVRLAKDSVNTDDIIVVFDPEAKNGYEPYQDADRLGGIGNVATLASYAAGSAVPLAINHMHSIDPATRIRLYASVTGNTSPDTLLVTGTSTLDSRYDLYLIDRYKKDSLLVSKYPRYLFSINPADTASYGANRFELVFHKKNTLNYRLISFTALPVSGGIQLTWKTENEQDLTGFQLEREDGSKQFFSLHGLQSDGSGTYTYLDQAPLNGTNYYRLRQDDAFEVVTYSSTLAVNKPVSAAAAVNAITVYPNPVTSEFTVALNTAIPARSVLRVTDSNGRRMLSREFSGSSVQQYVSNFLPGTYIVEVSDPSGKGVIGTAKFLKK